MNKNKEKNYLLDGIIYTLIGLFLLVGCCIVGGFYILVGIFSSIIPLIEGYLDLKKFIEQKSLK